VYHLPLLFLRLSLTDNSKYLEDLLAVASHRHLKLHSAAGPQVTKVCPSQSNQIVSLCVFKAIVMLRLF